MIKSVVAIVTCVLCSQAWATELPAVNAQEVRRSVIEAPLPAPQRVAGPGQEILALRLLANADKSRLYRQAESLAQWEELVALWTPILNGAGLKLVSASYKNGFGTLEYSSCSGKVVRRFIGEGLKYNALDPAAIAAARAEMIAALEKQGLTPLAAFNIDDPALRPTFALYYLTEPQPSQVREIQLRQLVNHEGLAYDLLENAVNVVKVDPPKSLVCIGRMAGVKRFFGTAEAALEAKVGEYRKFLTENGKEFIGYKFAKLEPPAGPNYSGLAVDVYFFQ